MHPLVSIIIPCYNAEVYISEAITSCLEQTYNRIEVIVVNDGSSDGSHDIIEGFGDKIILIGQTNMGGSAARNTGLRAAQGDFVKFLDADDFLEKDIIEKQVERFRQSGTGEKFAVYGNVNSVNGNGGFTGIIRQPLISDSEEGLATLIDYAIITSSPLYLREDLIFVNGFNETLRGNQEHELNIRLFLSGVRFRHFPDLVFNHRNYTSENRISCRKWPESDPLFMWRLIDHYELLLTTAGVEIKGAVASSIAARLISAARSLIRAGQGKLAEKHFSRALDICPEGTFRIGSRFWITRYYLISVKIIGLSATEKIYYRLTRIGKNF
jgi:glycosyltransferase involved in cell wall biosynthesis